MSPRVAVAADVHLESGANYGRSPGDRLRDQANVWEKFCSEAVTREVDAVLVAGDLFDRPKPSPAGYMAAMRGIRWLRAARIPTLIISGNHDVAGASDEACPLDIFDDPKAGIHVSKRPAVYDIGGVKVATLPWVSKSKMAAQLDGSDVDAPAQSVAERLVDVAAGLRADADVLLLHWALSGAVTSSGASTDEFREPTLSVPALEAQRWEWIVAGHIHKHQWVGSFDHGFYCGSLAVCDFSEADDWHGFAIIDTESCQSEWVDVEQRRFLTVAVAPDADSDWVLEDSHLSRDEMKDTVVRVRYACTEEERKRIDHRDIEERIYQLGAHRVYSIEATVQKPTRARVEQASLDLTPDEALTLWIEYQAIEPPRAERMRVEAASYEVAS